MRRLLDKLRAIAVRHNCLADYDDFFGKYVIFTSDDGENAAVYEDVRKAVEDSNDHFDEVVRTLDAVEIWF